MSNKLTKLSEEEIAAQMYALWNDRVVQKVTRYFALKGELERRHGVQRARHFLNAEIRRRKCE